MPVTAFTMTVTVSTATATTARCPAFTTSRWTSPAAPGHDRRGLTALFRSGTRHKQPDARDGKETSEYRLDPTSRAAVEMHLRPRRKSQSVASQPPVLP